ncbi:hypothetical protein PRIPAC_80084, partial [Pristionchus pacificus]|uniref:G protein-coupled receptor n=1 Tax=Pristionchus pacificus TaxID=54126 RepID=A0A2A6C473_PRIPA
ASGLEVVACCGYSYLVASIGTSTLFVLRFYQFFIAMACNLYSTSCPVTYGSIPANVQLFSKAISSAITSIFLLVTVPMNISLCLGMKSMTQSSYAYPTAMIIYTPPLALVIMSKEVILTLSSLSCATRLLPFESIIKYFNCFKDFTTKCNCIEKYSLMCENIYASLVIINAANLIVFFGIFSEFEHTHDSVPSREDFTNETIGIFNVDARLSTQMTLVYIIVASPIVFSFCLWMRRQIILNLDQKKLRMSTNSHMMHRMLLRALRAQLLISFIASFGSSLLILSIFNVLRSPMLNFVQLLVDYIQLVAKY